MGNVKKIYTNMLVPYDWYRELTTEVGKSEPNIELGKERLWNLYISLRSDEQVLTGNMSIDYPVSSLIAQEEKMRKDLENEDLLIAKKRFEGWTSDDIGPLLGVSGGAIRKRQGWKDYLKILESAGIDTSVKK